MTKPKRYTKHIKELMAKKTAILSKAEVFAQMGLEETATAAWSTAATLEEQIAPFMETLGRGDEAALHRVSAASCFEKSGEYARAANLYHAALSGPLSEAVTADVKKMLSACLRRLTRKDVKSSV